MEGRAPPENIIRNIVIEVMRECKKRHIQVTSEFLTFYIKVLQLDPNKGFTYDLITNRGKVQNLIKTIVGTLENKNDPTILTLKLQQEFRRQTREFENTIKQFRKQLTSSLYPLMLEIVEQDRRNQGETLSKKICYYAILASGLGNPNEKLVFREALQVFKSIFDAEEILVFPSLQNYVKQEVVQSLADIITGIRLYNKACKRGGEGMPDLPKLLDQALAAVKAELFQFIDNVIFTTRSFSRYVESCMVIVKNFKDEWTIKVECGTKEERQKWEFVKDVIAVNRQVVKTTGVILKSIGILEEHRKTLEGEFHEIVTNLNKIIVPTLYQAVTDVFPHFVQLTIIWKELQDDGIRLKNLFNIFKVQAQQIVSSNIDLPLDNQYSTYDHLQSIDVDDCINNDNPDITVHPRTEKFTRDDLEFEGFCCWALVNTDGALIPAVVENGVIEYKSQFYGFCTYMAANCFCSNPEQYIMKTIELARRRMHLVKLLNLEERLKESMHIKVLITKKAEPKIAASNAAVQTDTHFQDKYIDYNYNWNIWDQKAKLLKMRDIMSKTTKTVKTTRTGRMQSNFTQTYPLQDTCTQTRKENYGNTNRSLNFFQGLRGERGKYPFVMNLTEPQRYSQPKRK